MNRVISPGDRVLLVQRVRGYDRRAFHATVIEWTPKGRLKVKKGVDDRTVIVSPEDVKKLADGNVIDGSEKSTDLPNQAGTDSPKKIRLYLPE